MEVSLQRQLGKSGMAQIVMLTDAECDANTGSKGFGLC